MSPSVNMDAFRDACALFATGVAIATVLGTDSKPHGLTVSSFTSVSLNPPRILVCIDHGCTILSHFLERSEFAINVLSDEQRDLSVKFSVKPEGRFEGTDWVSGETGVPLIHACLAHFECRVEQTIECGDHTIFIGEVLAVRAFPGQPLLYFHRNYHTLG